MAELNSVAPVFAVAGDDLGDAVFVFHRSRKLVDDSQNKRRNGHVNDAGVAESNRKSNDGRKNRQPHGCFENKSGHKLH